MHAVIPNTKYYVNCLCLQANYDRYFACADVYMPAITYGLLEYYNDLQIDRGISEAYDLKFVHIMLKGFYGLQKMTEMDEIDYNSATIVLAKRKTFLPIN